jgi:hypothetical protein
MAGRKREQRVGPAREMAVTLMKLPLCNLGKSAGISG